VLQQEGCAAGTPCVPRVLVWPSCWYPNRGAPLSGLFVRRQTKAIAAFCPTAVLFVTHDPALKKKREIVFALEDEVPTVRAYFRPARPAPWRSLLDTLRFMAAAAAGRRALPAPFRDPDLVHVQVTPPLGLILSLKWFWRRKAVVFSEHWTKYLQPPGRENPLRKWFIRRFCARCRAVTAVSGMLAEGMRRHGLHAPDWRVIGNVIDAELFSPATGAIPRQDISLLHVSFQKETKNLAGIVRAMGILARRRSAVRLCVIGRGPTRAECEDLARSLGLLDRVVFFEDPLPEQEIAAVMRGSDILVVFSQVETFSCVAAEALACGLAVISTPTAVAEYLPVGSGILVPFSDERALAAAMEKMADRMPEFDRAPGPRVVRERFSPRVIGEQFSGLFREVLAKSRP
jgi:glycosyltransferase involved in cell wall biosynthesis